MSTRTSTQSDNTPQKFAAWLTTQTNANGKLFLKYVAERYANSVLSAPLKLDLPLPMNERDVFACRAIVDLDRLRAIFRAAPNYQEVNRNSGHGAFSAGLGAYRRYLRSLAGQSDTINEEEKPNMGQASTACTEQINTEVRRVDFAHTELCSYCDPVACSVNGEIIPVVNWRDLLITFIEKFISENNPKIGDLFNRPLPGSKRPFLQKGKPNGDARQLSTGHWVYVNLNTPSLIDLIGKLCRYCDVNLDNVKITYTLKTNKVFEHRDVVQEENKSVTEFVSDSIITVLATDYPNGFTFDTTAVRLLSEKSGMEVDNGVQIALKRSLFCRDDGIYFLLDVVANVKTRKEILEFADMLLDDYGCFEASELYVLFINSLNEKCNDGLKNFEAFYQFINRRDVRCVSHYGTRIVHVQNKGIHDLLAGIAQKIINITHNEFGGVISEDDLRKRFPIFGADLLANIIKEHAEELIKTGINGIVCYQTLDTLGISDEFSVALAKTLSEIDDLGLLPSEEVLHTTLSLRMGLNVKAEYNIPDDKTFRRLIAAYYKEAPKREWNRGVFVEARG